MFELARKLKKIEKLFETDKNGTFKRLKFVLGSEKVDLSGKNISDLREDEIVKLKKFSTNFINNSFKEAEHLELNK